ncbi:hypothetical protein ACIRPT_16830 [Streptomyces sp. NPDC101227]|uniref:hypothetical protein n=1 Tax=Streptomyces sp. NPDC101227 TaxID=3366136 RepID=UPI0038169321
MADDRYEWLDNDAAERLLRGDAVSAPDGDGARELQQLLDAAAAAAAGPAQSAELPGEAAAMAAFRRAQHGSGARPRRRVTAGRVPDSRTTRPGGVAERTRLARPFRRGFAVALAVCAIGGVAVAAGTGVLPTPFRGGGDPEPAASVSAAETPGTLESPPSGTETDGPASRLPSGSPGSGKSRRPETPAPGGSHGGSPPATTGPGRGNGGEDGSGQGDDGKNKPGKESRKRLILTLCREYESGKGGMDPLTRRRLERAAGGAEKVHAFCRKYLAGQGGGKGDDGLVGGAATGGQDDGGQNSGGQSGDEEDDEHPPATPSPTPTTPAPTPSTPATPAPSTTPAPTAGTPSTADTGQV